MATETLTAQWQTIATIRYQADVIARIPNRSAHGAICHLQARQGATAILGRKVNSNGRHQECGVPFVIDSERVAHWQTLGE